jgi:hypothetical protein
MAERELLQRSNARRPRMRGPVPGLWNTGGRMIRTRILAGGLEALREWFNDKSAFARIIAIQSPT